DIKRRHTAEQADAFGSLFDQHVERFADITGGALQQHARRVVALAGILENTRSIFAEVAGFCRPGKFDQIVGIIVELIEKIGRQACARMNAIMHKQAFLQQALTEPRAAAEIAQGETPAADRMNTTVFARDIGRTGAENGNDTVLITKRALKRDHAVEFYFGVREGEAALNRKPRALVMAASEAETRVTGRIMRFVQPGILKSVVNRRDHIDQRRLRIGDDIGGAAAP